MTRNQKIVHQQLEAQRWQADQAARPALSLREQAQALAIAMLAAKEAGDLDTARALALELRPLLSYLPE